MNNNKNDNPVGKEGSVEIGEHSGVWFGTVLRGDCGSIKVGKNSNIQDNCVVHADPGGRVSIGDNVTIGHCAIVHGCAIKDNVLVGMNATILNDTEIGSFSRRSRCAGHPGQEVS